jgi:hypothetical protein
MTGKQHDLRGGSDRMMQCSDKMTSRLAVDIIRAAHKLALTKY